MWQNSITVFKCERKVDITILTHNFPVKYDLYQQASYHGFPFLVNSGVYCFSKLFRKVVQQSVHELFPCLV